MTYLMVAGGLIVLLIGGDILVRGAVSLAERLRLPPLVIGLTVVAFGTSAPELVVSLEATLRGFPEIAIGNVVGSNIANVLLVLGLPALIFPIVCDLNAIRRDGSIMLATTIGFIAVCMTGFLASWIGAIMLAALGGYLYWSYRVARSEGDEAAEALVDEIEGIASRPHSLWLSGTFIIAGLIGLVAGSDLLVKGAVGIAKAANIPDATIGLTLVALGTSMPELATSLVAAIRRHGDVAIGNVIGSNLFNILGIMGVVAVVKPIPVPDQFLQFDLWVLLASALVLIPFFIRGHSIGRISGALFVIAYAAYVWSLFNGMSAMSVSHAATKGF